MAISMASILVHSEGVPLEARRELKRALSSPKARKKHLRAAAEQIWRQTDLGCNEILDLIGS